uniref:Claudin n=1 Tax=Denticeps clupeoides TaxID=299321 RepID=A0AAY4D800_9TELE
MAATMFQIIGFMLAGIGHFLTCSATAMDMWSLQDRSLTVVTNFYTYSGLWRSCVGTSYGTEQCRPYYTILGLPGLFQAVRALMIVGIVLGAIGVLIAIFALKCLKMGNMEDNVKATMTLTSGVMFILGGICGIAGVSIFANLIVTNFMFTTYSYSEVGVYTFGSALFVGWVGGGVLVVGGVLMCVAFPYHSYSRPHFQILLVSLTLTFKIFGIYQTALSRLTYNHMDGRQSKFDYV